AVYIPDGVDDAAVRSALLNDYSLEIGAGLGVMAGKVWRIGLMGHACNKRNVLMCLGALGDVLSRMNVSINKESAMGAAQKILAA
ncbi:MAG: alanine--glyoxylate aminotransferase family protein, partial [Gammaproteobacteria bacterium]|nr:alanine--glyoxylate aminotransferase family protein [Gammaproteobacteria bacterium]